MKRTILMVFILVLCVCEPVNAVSSVSAKSAVVIDADSGRVLFEKQADVKRLIASTTKIMTALIAVEQCDLSEQVLITDTMANVEGSSMYLKKGEYYTVQELLYGLLLASGNDAATAIAIHTAGTEEAFAALMNEKAVQLGMRGSHFENPHGLDHENHHSTAYDMAILAAYAMQNDTFAQIVSTRHITIKSLTYVNHNKLLWQCDGVIGVKTGYTKAAGRALVSCCERMGRRLICVTLSASDDWNDHKRLYDRIFDSYGEKCVFSKRDQIQLPLMSGNADLITVAPVTDVTVFVNEDDVIDYEIELPKHVFPPVSKGETAGQIVVYVNGIVLNRVNLVYIEDCRMNIDEPFSLNRLIQRLQSA